MAKPNPKFYESFKLEDLTYKIDPEIHGISELLVWDAAANGVLQHMQNNYFLPYTANFDRSAVAHTALAKNGSVVTLIGQHILSPEYLNYGFLDKIEVQVVNMRINDSKLIKLLREVAIDEGSNVANSPKFNEILDKLKERERKLFGSLGYPDTIDNYLARQKKNSMEGKASTIMNHKY